MNYLLPFTLLSDVKPFKCSWKVHVKVLHSWKQYNSVCGETLEMILSDERVVELGVLETIQRDKWLLSLQRSIRELTGCLEENVTSVSPRFKIHLMVKDDTGEARLMILDMVASGLISESATELLNGSFEELEDLDDLPEEITQIVGKTFPFEIYIEKEHIVYGSEIYKVGSVYKDRMECLSNDCTQADSRCSSGFSFRQSIDVYNEVMSTPSTKRKDDFLGSLDISSSTRNLRSKVVKVEKMKEL
ncbi:hypothetical protein Bca4012_065441 [Brassica carinata]